MPADVTPGIRHGLQTRLSCDTRDRCEWSWDRGRVECEMRKAVPHGPKVVRLYCPRSGLAA